MSAIAFFHVLDEHGLAAVVEGARTDLRLRSPGASERADHTQLAVRQHGRELLDRYDYSGYLLLDTLSYLSERGVPLIGPSGNDPEADTISEADCFSVLLRPSLKEYLPLLAPTAQDPADMLQHLDFVQVDAGSADQLAAGCLDGVQLLHDLIADLADHEIVLVQVG